MAKVSPINNRMKENYEDRQKTYLLRRTPVIVRVDGKCFSKFTRGLRKPFDEIFTHCMQQAMIITCERIGAPCFAYTQSDEISFLLLDYMKHDTSAIFDNNQQKLATIFASTVSIVFYTELEKAVANLENSSEEVDLEYIEKLHLKLNQLPVFDGRAFNIPREEVVNYFIGRQRDAIRNSVSNIARTLFSSKQLQGKSTEDRYHLLQEKGVTVDSYKQCEVAGSVYIKTDNWALEEETLNFTKIREQLRELIYCDERE